MSDTFIPDWRAIAESAIWKEQIEPALRGMYEDGLERRAGMHKAPLFGSDPMTIDEFHFWRGWCAAVKAIRESPAEFVEALQMKKQEETENARQRAELDRERRARAAAF